MFKAIRRLAGAYYTKEAPASVRKAGEEAKLGMNFSQATVKQLRKELGKTRFEDLPDGFIAGWASTPDKDHAMDVVVSGAFDESISAKGLSGPAGIKLLAQHRSDKPAGVITKLEQRTGGLWIEAQLNLNISYVKDLYEASKIQDGLNFSIGYRLVEGGFQFVDKGEDSYWLLTKLDLHEVSVVTFPCNDAAQMLIIKNGGPDVDPFDSIADFEKALVASGVASSRNEANRVTKWFKRLATAAIKKDAPLLEVEPEALGDVASAISKMRKAFTP